MANMFKVEPKKFNIELLPTASHAPMGEIIPRLTKRMGAHYPERSHKVVHASDITKDNFCPRQYALMDKLKVERPPRYINTALRATFDVGNATADLVREKWMADMAVGNWRCRKCGLFFSLCHRPSAVCKMLGPCDFMYEEVNFVDPDSKVSGSIDVLVDLSAPTYFITELKIMNPSDFDSLKAPLHEHRLRTALYLYLAAQDWSAHQGRVNVEYAKVLYVSRGFGKKGDLGQITPFKEFMVTRDDKSLAPYLDKAKKVEIFRSVGGDIPHGICPNPGCVTAKGCPVAEACFAQEKVQ